MREEMREMREKIREKMRPAPGRTCLRRPYRRGPRTVDHEQPVRNGLELTGDGGLRRGFTWQAGIGSSVGEASLGAACGDAARWTVGASCVRRVRRRRRCGGAMAVSGRRPRGGCAVRCPLEGPGAGARWASHHFAAAGLRRQFWRLRSISTVVFCWAQTQPVVVLRSLALSRRSRHQLVNHVHHALQALQPSLDFRRDLPNRQRPRPRALGGLRTRHTRSEAAPPCSVLRAPCSALRAPPTAR